MAEFQGRWIPKPGSIMATGAIMGTHGYAHDYATIWIERRRLAIAESFGWEAVRSHGELVQVRRWFNSKAESPLWAAIEETPGA